MTSVSTLMQPRGEQASAGESMMMAPPARRAAAR
jgi:hypothetical protein